MLAFSTKIAKNKVCAVIKKFYLKGWMAMHIKPELDVVHGRPALALKATYFRIREFKWGVRTRAKMPLKSAE